MQRFAQALHVVPKMLAENTGCKANVVIAELAAAHAEGKANAGFDIESDSSSSAKEDGTKHTIDAVEKQVHTTFFEFIEFKNSMLVLF